MNSRPTTSISAIGIRLACASGGNRGAVTLYDHNTLTIVCTYSPHVVTIRQTVNEVLGAFVIPMRTVLSPEPLAEQLSRHLTERVVGENEEACRGYVGPSPAQNVEMAWDAVERSLSPSATPEKIKGALQFGRSRLQDALAEAGWLIGERRVNATILDIFWEDFIERGQDGPQPMAAETFDGLLRLARQLHGGVVHSATDHLLAVQGHDFCFGQESQLRVAQIEVAALAILGAAGGVVYPSSRRERWPQDTRHSGLSHHLYVVQQDVKVPARLTRSNPARRTAPGVVGICWRNVVEAVKQEGLDLGGLACSMFPEEDALDATVHYVLEALWVERYPDDRNDEANTQSGALDVVQRVVTGMFSRAGAAQTTA